uniref:Uncharacterized protein n=1 Tax=Anguilla anguilla TaxID=7936 RepID=A0A0E9U746_ANGAN
MAQYNNFSQSLYNEFFFLWVLYNYHSYINTLLMQLFQFHITLKKHRLHFVTSHHCTQ